MTHAMTGPWLIVKWVGVAVLASYMAMLVFVFVRFRSRFSQLRRELIWPLLLGNLAGQIVPDLFYGNVWVKRVCFVLASLIYLYGLATLTRGLSQEGQHGLFGERKAEDCIQSLKLS